VPQQQSPRIITTACLETITLRHGWRRFSSLVLLEAVAIGLFSRQLLLAVVL